MNNLWRDEDAGATEIEQLVNLSNLIGSDLSLVQPGGGNTSVKLQEEDLFGRPVQTLVVKGSGTDLRTINAAGFTHLYVERLAALRDRDAMSDEDMMSLMRACMLFADRDPVPSVETPLHSLVSHRFVAHTHDVATLSMTDTPSAQEHITRVFGANVAFLEYVRPGFPLAKRLSERFVAGIPAGAIGLVLEKHGLAVWGETAKECYANLASVITRAEEFVAERKRGKRLFGPREIDDFDAETRRESAAAIAPVIRGELMRLGWRCMLVSDQSPETLEAIAGERFPEIAARGVMTPEHILRAGVRPLVLRVYATLRPIDLASPDLASPEEFKKGWESRFKAGLRSAIRDTSTEYLAYAARNNQPRPIPDRLKVIAIPGLGVFYAGKDRRNALVAHACYEATLQVMAGAEAIERFEFLSDTDACEVEYWPLERRKIDEAARRELDGKVAIIIGGGSGIGRATALRFAQEGAHLAIADLDLARAAALASEINAATPDRAFAVEADAADSASIESAVQEAVLRFGGVDILFYSPGVAPELHPVAEMPDTEIEHQLRVHYQGAVAATRATSQVMLEQGTPGRLIYNASKAAFAPGDGAAAYGASKAALAHYVRNVANELSQHGVTANYINADAVDTPLFRELLQERARQSGKTEAEMLERYAERSIFRTATVPPEAVAEAALWLASDRSAYTSGCVITVGGGAEGMPR